MLMAQIQTNPIFFQDIKNYIDNYDHDYFILCGDLNISLNPEINTYNYVGSITLKQEIACMMSLICVH